MSRIAVTVAVLSIFSTFGNSARADHHIAAEIDAKVRTMIQDFDDGKFKDVFENFALGYSIYLPYGLLKEVPNEQAKERVIKMYEDLREKGLRRQAYPQYIKVVVRGKCAVVTYLVDGIVKKSDDDKPEPLLTRETQIWQELDGDWRIVHMHISDLSKGPEEDD